jgi:DNA ligase (NAD+)
MATEPTTARAYEQVPGNTEEGTVGPMTIHTPLGEVAVDHAFATKSLYTKAVGQLRSAAAAYYNSDDTEMDDATYDQLAQCVMATEILNPSWVDGEAVATQVGAGVAAGGDVSHTAKMLSLDNVFSADELSAFMERVDKLVGRTVTNWRVEPKLDGLALSARYEKGRLVSLVTRGDGQTGDDTMHAAGKIAGLPLTLSSPETLEIRGEVVMTDADFIVANEIRIANGEPVLKNQRNGAAGTLRAQNRTYELPLSFFAYTLLEDGAEIRDQSAAMAYVASLGVSVSDKSSSQATHEGVVAAVFGFLAERGTIGVPIDGAVVKVDDLATRQIAGASSRAPRWAIAYKYPADLRSTELLDIVVEVGRTGNLSFTANLTPVDVGGVTVSAASVHNPSVIATKGLRLSDPSSKKPAHQKVWVHRAGDVIPEITAPVDDSTAGTLAFVAPTVCPRCGGELDTSGKIWRCLRGRICALEEVLTYAVSRDCLDIEGLGSSIVQGLVANGSVTKVSDLFELNEAALLGVDRLGEKVAAKILANIEIARSLPMSRIFCSLGVKMTGRSMSRRLATSFGTMRALRDASADRLQAVEAVGPERAARIVSEIALLKDDFDYLEAHDIGQSEPVSVASNGGGPLTGQTWVVTGSMTGALSGKSRNEVHELLESLGAKTSGSVSKTTTVLLIGEKAGSKADKATSLGVTVLTEAEFAEKYPLS